MQDVAFITFDRFAAALVHDELKALFEANERLREVAKLLSYPNTRTAVIGSGQCRVWVERLGLGAVVQRISRRKGHLLVFVRSGVWELASLLHHASGFCPRHSARFHAFIGVGDRAFDMIRTVGLEEAVPGTNALGTALASMLDIPLRERIAATRLSWSADCHRSGQLLRQCMTEPDKVARVVRSFVGGFRPGVMIRTVKGRIGRLLLEEGWSHPETDFTWSDGPAATVLIPAPMSRLPFWDHGIEAKLTGRAVAKDLPMTVLLDGQRPANCQVEVTDDLAFRLKVILRREEFAGPGFAKLQIAFGRTIRPIDRGDGDDARELGIALSGLTLRRLRRPGWLPPLRGIAARRPARRAAAPPVRTIRVLYDESLDRTAVEQAASDALRGHSGMLRIEERSADGLLLRQRTAQELIVCMVSEQHVLQTMRDLAQSRGVPLPDLIVMSQSPLLFYDIELIMRAEFQDLMARYLVLIGANWLHFAAAPQ